MSPIRVLLVDDHAVLRAALSTLIGEQDDIKVVGEAGSADQLLDLIAHARPDIVVMDLGMPGPSAFEAISCIADQYPGIRVIVLSMHKGRDIITRALESGADGYVPKSSAHSDLLQAIRIVHNGKAYLHPSASTALIESLRSARSAHEMLSVLSSREREVMQWTARGYSSREIGDMLSISGKTVETYRSRLMQKLGLEHRSELVDLAYQAGMLGEVALVE